MNKSPGNSAEEGRASAAVWPDAHGQASLLLVESLLHALVERGVLTSGEATTAVQVAMEVKQDLATHTGEATKVRDESLGLLAAIEQSFAAYGGDGKRRP